MKKAIIFIGIQASGKSTFYHDNFSEFVHVNLDTLHTRNKENRLLNECIANERSFVVDNTNPKKENRENFRSSINESIERNSARTGKAKVPATAIICTHSKLEIPDYNEGFHELYYVCIEKNKFIIKKWNDTK